MMLERRWRPPGRFPSRARGMRVRDSAWFERLKRRENGTIESNWIVGESNGSGQARALALETGRFAAGRVPGILVEGGQIQGYGARYRGRRVGHPCGPEPGSRAISIAPRVRGTARLSSSP